MQQTVGTAVVELDVPNSVQPALYNNGPGNLYWLYATNRGDRVLIRGVKEPCHDTPQCSKSRSR